MTDPLPECYLSGPPSLCPMCEALRACEARAREDERATVVAEFMSNHGDTATFDFGYAAGVKAALKVVEPWLENHSPIDDLMNTIDALRGES